MFPPVVRVKRWIAWLALIIAIALLPYKLFKRFFLWAEKSDT